MAITILGTGCFVVLAPGYDHTAKQLLLPRLSNPQVRKIPKRFIVHCLIVDESGPFTIWEPIA